MAGKTVSQNTPIVKENSPIRIDLAAGQTPVVSSVDVARHFQKKHKHVLAEIRKIIANTPKTFTGPNFRPSEYTDSTGRTLTAFLLSRDAFTLLAMGFTGKAAILWKLRYIEAFNALEAAALENQAELAREAGYLQGRQEALCLPVMQAERKRGYLDGLKEGRKLGKRQDGLRILGKILAYRQKGLSYAEIAKLLGISRAGVGERLSRARRLGLLEPRGNMAEAAS